MKDHIRTFIVDQLLSGKSISDDDDLLLSGLLDSMNVMRLVMHLETAFSVKVPPQDVVIENFTSVDTIAAYLGKRTTA
ncbi:MAG: acyl carrier protein [Pseudomonadota bacterium]